MTKNTVHQFVAGIFWAHDKLKISIDWSVIFVPYLIFEDSGRKNLNALRRSGGIIYLYSNTSLRHIHSFHYSFWFSLLLVSSLGELTIIIRSFFYSKSIMAYRIHLFTLTLLLYPIIPNSNPWLFHSCTHATFDNHGIGGHVYRLAGDLLFSLLWDGIRVKQ